MLGMATVFACSADADWSVITFSGLISDSPTDPETRLRFLCRVFTVSWVGKSRREAPLFPEHNLTMGVMKATRLQQSSLLKILRRFPKLNLTNEQRTLGSFCYLQTLAEYWDKMRHLSANGQRPVFSDWNMQVSLTFGGRFKANYRLSLNFIIQLCSW